MPEQLPLVSMILTTRDRPRLLAIALRCYQQQSYPHRELVVVDDGSAYPADAAAITAVGGRLLRVETGTPLGTKLNYGVREARGSLCQKMDDDDWYAPHFLETMVDNVQAARTTLCRPTLAFLLGFLFFDLASWEVRESQAGTVPGASLLFSREDCLARPFRALFGDEDTWYLLDQVRQGVTLLPVTVRDIFLAVRHRGSTRERGHTWTHQANGALLEDHLQKRPIWLEGPETMLPEWALATYREMHRELNAGAALGKGGEDTRDLRP